MMKRHRGVRRAIHVVIASCFIVISGVIGFYVTANLELHAAMPGISLHADSILPTPTPPSDNTLGLSTTSGPAGTHVFISASGYQPGEPVRPIWNYGSKAQVIEESFYYFNPVGIADANGVVYESFWTPTTVAGTYTIAAVGLKSGVVKTATFQIVPGLDLGIYIGPPGTILRLRGWSFGYRETLKIFWNWAPRNSGTLISEASSDTMGDFSNRSFVIPAGTPAGTYTIACEGLSSQTIATAQFTVGTPDLESSPSSSDWSYFGYNAQSTRVNPTETLISQSNVSTLTVKWKTTTPYPYKIAGSPIVVNGIVYVGTVEGFVIAIDAASGNILWTFQARGPVYGSPTVQNGIAYFGSVNYPSERLIGNYAYALNANNGALIWDDYLQYGGEWSTPIVSNGRVFFTSAYKEGASGGLSAFDVYTGQPLWSYFTPYGIWAPDTVDQNGTLYVGTGNPCYQTTPSSSCAGYMEAINPTTGGILWQVHLPGVSGDDDVSTAPLYDNGRLYFGLKSGYFYCMNATNGNIIWQYNTGFSGDSGIFSSATEYNGLVIFGGGDHLVHALDMNTGNLVWTFKTGSFIDSSPSIANGVLFIGSYDKYLYALNPGNGQKLWSFRTGGPLWASPAISNGVIYESSGDGNVYAFTPQV